MISLVIPAKDEEESIEELCTWIDQVMERHQLSYEILIIDDGSQDNTWGEINRMALANPKVKGIRFNQNYGKSAALHTGFQKARGEVIITMDADLQDSPDEVPELSRLVLEEGYHIVSGWKKKRHDPVLSKRWPSLFFNRITRLISGVHLHDFNCGLKAYQRQVAKSIVIQGEMHRYIPVVAKWSGFSRIGEKVVTHRKRKYGHTKFGWERFIRGFLDLLTLTFIEKFGRRPMHFFGSFGLLSFLIGSVFTIWLIVEKLYTVFFDTIKIQREITEKPIFYLALVALVIGSQLFLAGFLAEILARHRAFQNKYLISDSIGVD